MWWTRSKPRSKVELWQDANGKWRWQLIGANGEPINDHYETTSNALRGIEDFKAALRNAEVVFLSAPPNRSGRPEPAAVVDIDLSKPDA